MGLSKIGEPPYRIFTNAALGLWLIGENFQVGDLFEVSDDWSVCWSLPERKGTSFMRLTPKYLNILRQKYAGVKSPATEQFAEVIREHWKG